MIAVTIILIAVVRIAFFVWAAYLFSTHVPGLIADPGDMLDWAWTMLGVSLFFSTLKDYKVE